MHSILVAAVAVAVILSCAKDTEANNASRIIGGVQAPQGSYPTYVMLLENGRQSCGGTLISGNLVLTAAHCLKDSKTKDLTVARGNIKYDVKADRLMRHLLRRNELFIQNIRRRMATILASWCFRRSSLLHLSS